VASNANTTTIRKYMTFEFLFGDWPAWFSITINFFNFLIS
jgi:hypothetical protein